MRRIVVLFKLCVLSCSGISAQSINSYDDLLFYCEFYENPSNARTFDDPVGVYAPIRLAETKLVVQWLQSVVGKNVLDSMSRDSICIQARKYVIRQLRTATQPRSLTISLSDAMQKAGINWVPHPDLNISSIVNTISNQDIRIRIRGGAPQEDDSIRVISALVNNKRLDVYPSLGSATVLYPRTQFDGLSHKRPTLRVDMEWITSSGRFLNFTSRRIVSFSFSVPLFILPKVQGMAHVEIMDQVDTVDDGMWVEEELIFVCGKQVSPQYMREKGGRLRKVGTAGWCFDTPIVDDNQWIDTASSYIVGEHSEDATVIMMDTVGKANARNRTWCVRCALDTIRVHFDWRVRTRTPMFRSISKRSYVIETDTISINVPSGSVFRATIVPAFGSVFSYEKNGDNVHPLFPALFPTDSKRVGSVEVPSPDGGRQIRLWLRKLEDVYEY